jgi:hypothetical protein
MYERINGWAFDGWVAYEGWLLMNHAGGWVLCQRPAAQASLKWDFPILVILA